MPLPPSLAAKDEEEEEDGRTGGGEGKGLSILSSSSSLGLIIRPPPPPPLPSTPLTLPSVRPTVPPPRARSWMEGGEALYPSSTLLPGFEPPVLRPTSLYYFPAYT